MMRSDSILLLICLFGGIASAISGLATGWIAHADRIKNTLVMGLLSAVTSLVFLPLMHGYPAWYISLAGFSTISFSCLGGYLADLAFESKRSTIPEPILP
jgi:predicted MFS family arabinose efflux permease